MVRVVLIKKVNLVPQTLNIIHRKELLFKEIVYTGKKRSPLLIMNDVLVKANKGLRGPSTSILMCGLQGCKGWGNAWVVPADIM